MSFGFRGRKVQEIQFAAVKPETHFAFGVCQNIKKGKKFSFIYVFVLVLLAICFSKGGKWNNIHHIMALKNCFS
jgi:hypothetical protein